MAGAVIWITGMSGAGKSSVATELVRRLRAREYPVVLLDGDDLRWALGAQSGYDAETRTQLSWTYARLCRLISAQDHIVVCATISLRHDIHRWNREQFACYLEVVLDVPTGVLYSRNSKGIYRSGGADVVGVDVPAEFPRAPDLRIPNYHPLSASTAAKQIFDCGVTKGIWQR
ncbi:adenylyl-sulfate kinase [Amycolatopsis pithecellobii]|uniref:Adenylyl-sulfate kinase n=1 Tax=Amycolatopsis pithecellobii TaxID=664692 RepID=A0A6N7YZD7_9PSEU|nr:adenylyl-sulfate kinase [Amycolatopsis pithecellobii]MTD54273.1 adenylyl-sulfate kinase [Amycolatopsis pithecellobii]